VSALRPYEVLVIVDPRPTDEEVAALLTQLGEHVTSLGAAVVKMENWGKRRLAYDIRKQREGTYAVFEISSASSRPRSRFAKRLGRRKLRRSLRRSADGESEQGAPDR
jgi:small subunit ribosomal protein S6